MNIAILYLHDSAFAEVAAVTLPVARAWVERHGYRLIEVLDPPVERNIQWHRVKVLQLLMEQLILGPKVDYALNLDADVLITNPEIHLEDLIKKYGPFDIAMSREKTGAWNDGTCLFANTQRTRDFLQVAWGMEHGTDVTSLNGAVQKLFDAGTLADHVTLVEIPKREFNSYWDDWHRGDFVLHLPGTGNERRVYLFKEVLKLFPLKELLHPYQLSEGDELVRLGWQLDGGYLVPRSVLKEGSVLDSFGIGADFSFELDWVNKTTGFVVMYDHTVDIDTTGECLFFHKVRCTPEIVAKLLDCSIAPVLKFDIEGDEYACLMAITKPAPLALIVEFHWIDQHEDALRATLAHLDKLGFKIVHVHGNNHGKVVNGLPETVEVTFVNTTLIPVGEPFKGKLPLPGLDFPNNPDAPDYEMEFS